MANIVSFSGGRTSAYMLWLLNSMGKADRVYFMDTGAEHPKTYEFIRNIRKYWGIDIRCIRAKTHEHGVGNTPLRVKSSQITNDHQPFIDMVAKYGVPRITGPFCTARMKKTILDKICKPGDVRWMGIRVDEPRRLRKKDGYAYLADISDFEKQDVLDWWKEQPFDLGIPEHLGNCVFCIKKNPKKIALAAMDEPGIADEWRKVIGDATPYRGGNSLDSIIAMFKGQTKEDIVATMKHDYDAGNCSESCEVIDYD